MTIQWTGAVTLRDFGECMALWLEGKLPHMPTRSYDESVGAEGAGLVPLLAALNRSGKFITTNWQPACTRGHRPYGGIMQVQRAAVMGFVPADAIEQVQGLVSELGGDVDVSIQPPHSNTRKAHQLASQNDGRDITWFGYVLNPAEIARDYGGVRGRRDLPGLRLSIIAGLQRCYQVSIVDQVWGRNEVLWPALRRLIAT